MGLRMGLWMGLGKKQARGRINVKQIETMPLNPSFDCKALVSLV